MVRKCAGYEGHDCQADISDFHWNTVRCLSCKPKRGYAQQLVRNKRKSERRRSQIVTGSAVVKVEVSEELRVEILRQIKLDVPFGEISDRYGVPRKKLIDINCQHHQRRARISEDA